MPHCPSPFIISVAGPRAAVSPGNHTWKDASHWCGIRSFISRQKNSPPSTHVFWWIAPDLLARHRATVYLFKVFGVQRCLANARCSRFEYCTENWDQCVSHWVWVSQCVCHWVWVSQCVCVCHWVCVSQCVRVPLSDNECHLREQKSE